MSYSLMRIFRILCARSMLLLVRSFSSVVDMTLENRHVVHQNIYMNCIGQNKICFGK
jgi:hypothetical protein